MKRDFEDIPNSAITNAINEYVHSERDRQVLKLYLCDGYSMFDIANKMDISFKTVQRIIAKHEEKVFRHI